MLGNVETDMCPSLVLQISYRCWFRIDRNCLTFSKFLPRSGYCSTNIWRFKRKSQVSEHVLKSPSDATFVEYIRKMGRRWRSTCMSEKGKCPKWLGLQAVCLAVLSELNIFSLKPSNQQSISVCLPHISRILFDFLKTFSKRVGWNYRSTVRGKC